MILDLDCGNTFIKWRVVSRKGIKLAGGTVITLAQLLDSISARFSLQDCRIVSVRSEDETTGLLMALTASGLTCHQALPAKVQAGVRNGYDDYRQLGLDRWLGILGAYHLSGRRACLILDIGTAAVADYVNEQGLHLGGFICPGLQLMRDELCNHTRRIRYDREAARLATKDLIPGCNTAEAVERGCWRMLKNFVQDQYQLAKALLGNQMQLYLTGGDAVQVSQDLPEAIYDGDLVFKGLAIAYPLEI